MRDSEIQMLRGRQRYTDRKIERQRDTGAKRETKRDREKY